MSKEIVNKNQKRQFHGYQEWYYKDMCWLRGRCVNDRYFGYVENSNTKRVVFYIL